MIRIQSATPIGGLRLRLRVTDGQVIERDIADELAGEVFAELRGNPSLFAQVQVEDGTLVWPNGLDLCPDMVIWGGAPPADVKVRAS